MRNYLSATDPLLGGGALLGSPGVEFYRLIEQRIELSRIETQRKQILLEAEKGWQQERNHQEAKRKAYYTPLPEKRFSEYDAERLADHFGSHPPTPFTNAEGRG